MEKFKKSVCEVMSFLEEEHFSASVISQHRLAYQSLSQYLSRNAIDYLPYIGHQWVESNQKCWNYRKYTGYRHCIDQLNDVFTTGTISPTHLSFRKPAYSLLNSEYRLILDAFISDINCNNDGYRIACSRFLLYLQNKNIHFSAITYGIIISFYNDDHHKAQKSKDRYENYIRIFLKYLASTNLCDIGLSLALNKLLINKIITISSDELEKLDDKMGESYEISWAQVSCFLSELENIRYGKTVIKSSKHILTLLYLFLQMHNVRLNCRLIWYWYDRIKPLLGSNAKQQRRSLFQFIEYIKSGNIVTSVTGNPNTINSIDTLPNWMGDPLKSYLALLKREGLQPSTLNMYKSSNLRFCKYIKEVGIGKFLEITPEVINNFNLQDKHSTPEGKAAYNCRIRSFIIYLFEQKLITNEYLYKALPTFASNSVSIVQTLQKEDVEKIWAVDPESLNAKEARDYAMLCIGLTMGFRACDIVSLRFDNIDWKKRCISITQQKTGKLITMPMPVKTANIIYRYILKGRPKSHQPYIFIRHEAPYDCILPGVCRSALKRFLSPSSNSKYKFHSVRKTFASQLLAGNTNIELISTSLGHLTNNTVHKYLSLDESKMRLCAISLADVGISYKGGAFNA